MKITNYPREERQYRDMGFIEIYFSFRPDFSQPKRRNFGVLYNLDDARMPPNSRGFGMHPHRDMEVVTLFLEGVGHHEDTTGNIGITKAKAVQLITSGTGIMHEEYNYSKEEPFRGIQMFLHPKEKGVKPNYQKRELILEDYYNKLSLLISPDGRKNTLQIANNSFMSYGILNANNEISYQLNNSSNGLFIKVIEGEIEVAGNHLRGKDEIGIEDVNSLTIFPIQKSEIMVMEVPML